MARATFVNYPHKFMNIKFPEVIGINTINIDLFDNVTSITIISESLEYEINAYVENNEIDLSGILYETGTYTIKVDTESEGVYEKDIEIEEIATKLVFNVLPFDFELGRVDENNFPVYEDDELYRTFVTTDVIRIQFYEEEDYSLEEEGYSYTDIVWEVKGVTENDGTVNEQDSGWDFVHAFTPNPINRPNQSGSGSREPNEPIRYMVYGTILGLKKCFELIQDGKDVLRQEYIDYGTSWIPRRDETFSDNGDWNTGNYSFNEEFNENAGNYPYNSGYIVAQGNNRFQQIWNQLLVNYNNLCSINNVTSEGLRVNSAFRNPQRNNAVGSVLINSNHTIGHAMDVRFLGAFTSLKWNLLHDAAEQINDVSAICEIGPTQVSCDNPNVTHVHISW